MPPRSRHIGSSEHELRRVRAKLLFCRLQSTDLLPNQVSKNIQPSAGHMSVVYTYYTFYGIHGLTKIIHTSPLKNAVAKGILSFSLVSVIQE